MRASQDEKIFESALETASEKNNENAKKKYELGDVLHDNVDTPEEDVSNIDDIFSLITSE